MLTVKYDVDVCVDEGNDTVTEKVYCVFEFKVSPSICKREVDNNNVDVNESIIGSGLILHVYIAWYDDDNILSLQSYNEGDKINENDCDTCFVCIDGLYDINLNEEEGNTLI